MPTADTMDDVMISLKGYGECCHSFQSTQQGQWREVTSYLSSRGYKAPHPPPHPPDPEGTHKGLVQVGHFLLELWRLDVGVGQAHHNHTPEWRHIGAKGTWGSQGPGHRTRSSPTTAAELTTPVLKLCSVVLPLPPHPIPPGKRFFSQEIQSRPGN